ncbi:MAG: arylamine N-acetyltransferase [Pyrinomonadaceae bacterium]
MDEIHASHAGSVLDPRTLGAVMERFGLPTAVSLDHAGLTRVYAAWCENVPFDNIQKLISLADGGRMPGLDAGDFFENWLEHGCGGTCWPSSGALHALLVSLGFRARRSAGSMFDVGLVNHGTVKVTLDDGAEWMVDTSILSYAPLPLSLSEPYVGSEARMGVEVEPLDDGTHLVWIDFVPLADYVPCRLDVDPAGDELYFERYEIFSRLQSPFNERLYFRKGGVDGTHLVFGNTKFRRLPDGGVEIRVYERDELCAFLLDEGVSQEMIDRWISAGGLEKSFGAAAAGPHPEINGRPPSRR